MAELAPDTLTHRLDRVTPFRSVAVAVATLFLVASCATAPPKRLEVYPMYGQTPEQLDRDEWECGLWAQKQTGFDPGTSLRNGALAGLFLVGGVGSAMGAAIGATQAAAGTGAAVGAVSGLAVGAPVGGPLQYRQDLNATQRAFQACIEGRGYGLR